LAYLEMFGTSQNARAVPHLVQPPLQQLATGLGQCQIALADPRAYAEDDNNRELKQYGKRIRYVNAHNKG